MPSAQDCAERLREQAQKTLSPHIRNLEEEFQTLSGSLSQGVYQIERKLEALRQTELPTSELVLDEILSDISRQKNQELGSLAHFARGLKSKETQEEILAFLLDSAHKHSPRLALFAIRGDRFIGWSSRGYADDLARNISSYSFPRSECPEFCEALESDGFLTVSNPFQNEDLQSIQQGQESWSLYPLRVMQRPVALLLAGGSDGISSNSDVLLVMAASTVLRIENIALRILYELTIAKSEPTDSRASEEKTVSVVPAEPPKLDAPMSDSQESRVEEEPVQETAVEIKTAEKEFKAETRAETQNSNVMPPQQPEAPDSQQPDPLQASEEEKLHSDAKRFARLLVSEIKLYNERMVAEGRQNRDLYLRLKKDIDRSRDMYDKRISPIVLRKIDYFHDEIIRILGDNDPSTLGSDYPGPRVEN